MSDHLARSTAFHLFSIQDGAAGSASVRERESGECGNHRTFVEMLAGCDAVICGGIGDGALQSLAAHGIRSIVAVERPAIQDAVMQFLAGTLKTTTETVCLCSHP
ncbi:MAG: NifB/NifX family molybdenum-iron cluster-binding protein [Acidobacteria bacterium]|nr:NifB/NifX family molybdenum-iron cluster-binding protein [Acidobacteriota bacterium]